MVGLTSTAYKPAVTVLAGVPSRNSAQRWPAAANPIVPTPAPIDPPTTTSTSTTTTTTTTTPSTTMTMAQTEPQFMGQQQFFAQAAPPAPFPGTPSSPHRAGTPYDNNQDFNVPQTDPQSNAIVDATKADYMTLVRKNAATHRDICSSGFAVDAAVQGQDGRILIFSGTLIAICLDVAFMLESVDIVF